MYKMNEVFKQYWEGKNAYQYDKDLGIYYPARSQQLNDGSFHVRLRDAWKVLRGEAQAIKWD